MSILKDFYDINSVQKIGEEKYEAQIFLNKDHQIFEGHFPGNPVSPGVCMMQIVKDITEKILEKKLIVSSASNVKFMAIINPNENPELTLNLEIKIAEDEIKVKNTTIFGETIALKMTVNYKTLA